jgi:hypothetical protein
VISFGALIRFTEIRNQILCRISATAQRLKPSNSPPVTVGFVDFDSVKVVHGW